MLGKVLPALVGALLAGVLSAVPVVNSLCAVWAALGGALAVLLYVRRSQGRFGAARGIAAGLGVGLVASAVFATLFAARVVLLPQTIITFELTPIDLADWIRNPPSWMRYFVDPSAEGIAQAVEVLMLVSGLLGSLALPPFAAVGGLIAVLLFDRRAAVDV